MIFGSASLTNIPAVSRLPVEETAVEPDDVADRDAHALAEFEVGDAVCRSRMDDSGALIHVHQLGSVEHHEREAVGEHVGEQRLVGQVDEVRSVHLLDDLVVPVEHGKAFLGEDVRLIVLRDPDVRLARVHGERDVARAVSTVSSSTRGRTSCRRSR